jgi:acetyl esterase/lipase
MTSWQSKLTKLYLRQRGRRPLTPDSKIIAIRQKEARIAARRRYKGPAEIVPVTIGTLKAEWVRPPKAEGHRVILYFHGGGYCFGSPAEHRHLVARLCESAQARGLSIDYRLAPEHPFPAALDDAVTAYRWLIAQGINPAGIILAGDSAGGGLAIATAMALRDGGAPLPRAIVTLSPWTDLALTGWTILTKAQADPSQSWETLAVCARHYLKNTAPTNPFASPLYGNFRGLPPLLIHVGSDEILRDDATRVAERAEAAGCDVSVEVWDGMPHVFQFYTRLPEARGSLDRIGSFIRSRTATPPDARATERGGLLSLRRAGASKAAAAPTR